MQVIMRTRLQGLHFLQHVDVHHDVMDLLLQLLHRRILTRVCCPQEVNTALKVLVVRHGR